MLEGAVRSRRGRHETPDTGGPGGTGSAARRRQEEHRRPCDPMDDRARLDARTPGGSGTPAATATMPMNPKRRGPRPRNGARRHAESEQHAPQSRAPAPRTAAERHDRSVCSRIQTSSSPPTRPREHRQSQHGRQQPQRAELDFPDGSPVRPLGDGHDDSSSRQSRLPPRAFGRGILRIVLCDRPVRTTVSRGLSFSRTARWVTETLRRRSRRACAARQGDLHLVARLRARSARGPGARTRKSCPALMSASSAPTIWYVTSSSVSMLVSVTVAPNRTLVPQSLLGSMISAARQLVLDVLDARLDHALALLGGVVLGVLAEVAVLARNADFAGDLRTFLLEPSELFLELLGPAWGHRDSLAMAAPFLPLVHGRSSPDGLRPRRLRASATRSRRCCVGPSCRAGSLLLALLGRAGRGGAPRSRADSPLEVHARTPSASTKRRSSRPTSIEDWEEADLLFKDVKRKYGYSRYARLAELRLADVRVPTGEVRRGDQRVQGLRSRLPQRSRGRLRPLQDCQGASSSSRAMSFSCPPLEERDLANVNEAHDVAPRRSSPTTRATKHDSRARVHARGRDRPSGPPRALRRALLPGQGTTSRRPWRARQYALRHLEGSGLEPEAHGAARRDLPEDEEAREGARGLPPSSRIYPASAFGIPARGRLHLKGDRPASRPETGRAELMAPDQPLALVGASRFSSSTTRRTSAARWTWCSRARAIGCSKPDSAEDALAALEQPRRSRSTWRSST